MAAATLGRAITTIPTTWLYDRVGIAASVTLAAGWALVATVTMRVRLRSIVHRAASQRRAASRVRCRAPASWRYR
jgi:hypothetical protein